MYERWQTSSKIVGVAWSVCAPWLSAACWASRCRCCPTAERSSPWWLKWLQSATCRISHLLQSEKQETFILFITRSFFFLSFNMTEFQLWQISSEMSACYGFAPGWWCWWCSAAGEQLSSPHRWCWWPRLVAEFFPQRVYWTIPEHNINTPVRWSELLLSDVQTKSRSILVTMHGCIKFR